MNDDELFPVKCDNELCINEYEGRCSLGSVTFDFLGNCCDCDNVDIPLKTFKKIKKQAKKDYFSGQI